MTVLTIDDNYTKYIQKVKSSNVIRKGYMAYILVLICITVSTIIYVLDVFEWEPLEELRKIKMIKDNYRSWAKLITDKTDIETRKGRIASVGKPELFNFKCYDMGSYNVAVRLNTNNYLPEFIQRGVGDVWKFNKANTVDTSSLQFCKYNIYKGDNNIITCGQQMFNIVGYSGYFESDHPCQTALKIITTVI